MTTYIVMSKSDDVNGDGTQMFKKKLKKTCTKRLILSVMKRMNRNLPRLWSLSRIARDFNRYYGFSCQWVAIELVPQRFDL